MDIEGDSEKTCAMPMDGRGLKLVFGKDGGSWNASYGRP